MLWPAVVAWCLLIGVLAGLASGVLGGFEGSGE
jgi:uncharacterized membrane protein YfcA